MGCDCCQPPDCPTVQFKGVISTMQRRACGVPNFDGEGLYKNYRKTAAGSITCTDEDGDAKTLSSDREEVIDYGVCDETTVTATGSTTETQSDCGGSGYETSSESFPFFLGHLSESNATRRLYVSNDIPNCEVCGATVGTMSGSLSITEEYTVPVTEMDICAADNEEIANSGYVFLSQGSELADLEIDLAAGIATFSSTQYGIYFACPASCKLHAEWDEVTRDADGLVVETVHRVYNYSGSCSPTLIIDPQFSGAGGVFTLGLECTPAHTGWTISLENLTWHCNRA